MGYKKQQKEVPSDTQLYLQENKITQEWNGFQGKGVIATTWTHII